MPKHTEHPASPSGPASRLGGVHNDATAPAQGASTYYTMGGRQIDPNSREGRSIIEADKEYEAQNTADAAAEERNIPDDAAQRRNIPKDQR